MGVKDKDWKEVTVAAATELSATFNSSDPGTHTTIPCQGAIGVKFKATAVVLTGAASELRVTPRFKDATGNETFAQFPDGSPAYQVITDAGRETEIYWDIDAVEVGVEPWLDAADSTASCSLSLKRIYPRA